MTVEQSQLVDQHRSQSETLSVDQSSGGNLPVHLEDGLEMLVEVLVSHAAQLVEDASDFDASIGVRVSSSFGGDQKPLGALACLPDVGRVVVDVSEHEAGFFWQLLDQVRGHLVVCRVSGGEPGTKRDPNLTDGDGQMQLPPVHPPVPAALGPVSLGAHGRVGWASPARADTLTLRDPIFFYSILLEVGRALVAKRRVQPAGVVEGLQVLEDGRLR